VYFVYFVDDIPSCHPSRPRFQISRRLEQHPRVHDPLGVEGGAVQSTKYNQLPDL